MTKTEKKENTIKIGKNAVYKDKNYGKWWLIYKGKHYPLDLCESRYPFFKNVPSGKILVEAVFEAGMQKCKDDIKEIIGVRE